MILLRAFYYDAFSGGVRAEGFKFITFLRDPIEEYIQSAITIKDFYLSMQIR